jgi:choline-sulfatase
MPPTGLHHHHRVQRTGKLMIAAVGLLLGTTVATAAPEPRSTAPRSAAVNVILITMDTLRADHVGCYGATQVQTPTLDALCRDSLVFEHAFTQVPLTWPAHVAILTGTYPYQNGVQDFTGQPLSSEFRTIVQAFKQRGYATAAVISAFVLDRSWGLSRGFDFYDDAFSAQDFQTKEIGLVERKAGESVTHAISWLQATQHRPFFLWLHLYDPHSPYDPPEPYRAQYRQHPYDGEIAYADHELGRLTSWLKRNRLYDHSLIVFLSDHGESLGEHGESEHGFFVYNATVRVPLIVKAPVGSGFQPKRVSRTVESIAVAPTLLKLAGIKDAIQKQFQTASLMEADSNHEDGAYSETFYPFSSFGWSPLHSLETSRYHYIEATDPELYDVISDPEEKSNLASQQTAVVSVLKEKLQQRLKVNSFARSSEPNSGLSPDTLERLRALGYVAYRAPVSAQALAAGLPDPKKKIGEFNTILQAGDALRAGAFPTAKALLAEVRESDPQMYVVPFMLGEAANKQHKWEQGALEFQKCLELNPYFDQAMTGMAQALANLGDASEAKQWVEKALQYNPQNFRGWYELGHIEAKSDPAAAIAAYERAVAIQPNFPLARRDLGMMYIQQKRYGKAAVQLSKAAKLGLEEAPVFNYLGIAYSQTSRQERAIESYQKALKLDPTLAEAHLNLGFAYEKLRREQEAKQEYDEACRLSERMCQLVRSRQE